MKPGKPLERRTPLRSVRPNERVGTATKRRRPPRKSTGPTNEQRQDLLARADGRCERCGVRVAAYDGGQWVPVAVFSDHHRQPRGKGGTTDPEVNSPTNRLVLCGDGVTGCHGEVESQRELSYAHGWLVKRPADPATVPVETYAHGRVLLTNDNNYREAEPCG